MLEKSFSTKAVIDYELKPGQKQFNIVKDKEYVCTPAFGGYMVHFGTDAVHFTWANFGKYFIEPEKKDW